MLQAIDHWFRRVDRSIDAMNARADRCFKWIDAMIARTPSARRRRQEIDRVRAMIAIVEKLRVSLLNAQAAERASTLRQDSHEPSTRH